MKLKLLLLSILFASNFFVQAQDYKFIPAHKIALDTSTGVAMLKQCSRDVPKKVKAFWSLETSDLNALHKNFKKIYQIKSREDALKNNKVDDLALFGYQYIGFVINDKKYIYVNAYLLDRSYMSDPDKKPSTKAITACNGGLDYWGVLYDVEKEEFEQLIFNNE